VAFRPDDVGVGFWASGSGARCGLFAGSGRDGNGGRARTRSSRNKNSFAQSTRYYHPSSCQVISGTATFNTSGQIGNATTGPVKLWCPLISDPTVSIPSASGLYFDGASFFKNSTSTSAAKLQICEVFAGGGGQSCGGESTTSQSGVNQITALLPTNPVVGDYYYMIVTLGPIVGGSSNTFFGYSFTDN